jgi:hypothetical protein
MSMLTYVDTALDASLLSTRMKVDKLVRVKRLLSRLEFLSELPEKLEVGSFFNVVYIQPPTSLTTHLSNVKCLRFYFNLCFVLFAVCVAGYD